ncbi:MAG: divalent-cation tolerance protein CutA [Acidobacteria bacterium]|nr:divalent-cation tolerance protein CutA [Acidobacteriota bacterium]
MTDALVVLTTVENPQVGERLAEMLVEGAFAACVQVLPPMTSIYRWEGRTHRDSECLLLIKTTRAAYPGLEAAIRDHHTYQTPEILALSVEAGAENYLQWLVEMVGGKR